MNVEQLATALQTQIATSTPEELATLLFQLVTMKPEFDGDETKQKTYRMIFAKISARLALKAMAWGM